MKKFFKLISCALLILTTFIFSFIVFAFNVTSDATFDKNKLIEATTNTTYYDCNGQKMVDASTKNISKIKLSTLHEYTKNAFVAIEDKRFYTHNGIDTKRILGATIKNIKYGKIKEGASTISQQLIKNTHLTNEKTISRKLKEIKLTRILEKNYSKDEILEMYLNTIYFGESAYGIESAAQTYFGKPSSELLLSESATLAAIIKAPSTYSPYKNIEKATERRNLTLKCMLEQGYINNTEYKQAKESPIELNYNKKSKTEQAYINCVKEETEEILKNIKYNFYDKLNIYTYYNRNISEMIENETLDQLKDSNYSAILTDNTTHGVIAIATDTGMIKRCPASTVKPWLVYAPALEEKQITLATKIDDSKTNFNGYSPSNYNDKYYGYVSVKEAISKSLNIPAVKTANFMGMERLKKYASKMNINLDGGLDVALGGINGGMTLKEIVDCYSVFSCYGNYQNTNFIYKITDKDGRIIYKHTQAPTKVFSESTTHLINDALKECAQNGTSKKIFNKKITTYAKTGTNGNKQGNFDAYSISYTPEYTLGVWYGKADNLPMDNSISGGTYPTVVAAEIWKNISEICQLTDFTPPFNVINIILDKKAYEQDYKLIAGTDGPEYLFAAGTEPSTLENQNTKEVVNIKQENNKNNYILSFCLVGYDGAIISCETNNKVYNKEIREKFCQYTTKLKEKILYTFTITPYSLDGNIKNYDTPIQLPSICLSDEEIKPPYGKWWLD